MVSISPDKMISRWNYSYRGPDDDISCSPKQLISYKYWKQLSNNKSHLTERHLPDSHLFVQLIYVNNFSLIFKDESIHCRVLVQIYSTSMGLFIPPHPSFASKWVILVSCPRRVLPDESDQESLKSQIETNVRIPPFIAVSRKLVSCQCTAQLFPSRPRSRSSWGPYSFDYCYLTIMICPTKT